MPGLKLRCGGSPGQGAESPVKAELPGTQQPRDDGQRKAGARQYGDREDCQGTQRRQNGRRREDSATGQVPTRGEAKND
ncbi:hypothetical protein GCM10017710_32350 [Arthrobacter ramosus]